MDSGSYGAGLFWAGVCRSGLSGGAGPPAVWGRPVVLGLVSRLALTYEL